MSQKNTCILAVDDNKVNLKVVEKALTDNGFEILTATDGPSALSLIDSESPDLVLLDVMMPGMSGYEVCQQIRAKEETRLLPVVMLTALNDVSDKIQGIEAGADDFLSKPFHREELITRVKSLLRIKRLHDEIDGKNRLLRTLFGRYVSEDVAAEIVSDPENYLRLGGDKRRATILFGDLRGFTTISDQIDPQDSLEIINVYLSNVVDSVFEFGGTLDKFRGDGVMAIFGAPVAHEDDPARAVQCALRIQEKLRGVSFSSFPNIRLNVGIGINTGEVIAGNVGTERRMDYTVIGDEVNLAQRFEASAGPSQILITGSTFAEVKGAVQVRELGGIRVKGKSDPVPAYDVLGWNGTSS